MRLQPWGSVYLLVLAFSACWPATLFVLGDEAATTYIGEPSETRIQTALDQQLDWESVDAPLSDVAEQMAEACGIEILFDTRALEDVGMDSATPITQTIRGVSARSVLRLMLRELELTYVIRDSALWITTVEQAEAQLITRVYPVGDIVNAIPETYIPASAKRRSQKEDILSDAIAFNIAPDSWDSVGGPGTIEGIYDSLVISQTNDMHELVASFLQTYRALIKADASPEGLGVRPLMVGLDRTEHLLLALERPVTMIIRDEPLVEALAALAEDFQVPIVLDKRALDDFGIGTDTPVTGRFAEVPLRLALKRLLASLELTYIFRNEIILVTTLEEAEASLQVGLYPVGNLVRDGSADPTNYDFDSLIEVITSAVAPDTWDIFGGPAAIDTLLPAPTLVISQTRPVHEQITKLLLTLETAKKQSPKKKAEAIDPDAITVKSYQSFAAALGFVDPAEVIAILVRDSKDVSWDEEDVFIEPLGQAIVVKHNAKVHARVKKVLTALGFWDQPQFGGPKASFSSGGSQPAKDAQKEAAPQGGGPGGFF